MNGSLELEYVGSTEVRPCESDSDDSYDSDDVNTDLIRLKLSHTYSIL